MGKNKRKEKSSTVSYPIEKELDYFQKTYCDFLSFVSLEEIRSYFEESVNTYQKDIDFGLHALYYAETRLFLRLKEILLEENIDLEITLIDHYRSKAKMVLGRLGYHEEDENQVIEEGIADALLSYDGNRSFQIAIVDSLKKRISKEQNPTILDEPKEEEKTTITKKEKKKKEKKNKNLQVQETSTVPLANEDDAEFFKDLNILLKDDKKRLPNEMEELIGRVDIVRNSPLQDVDYLRFLALKYGYYEHQFFDLNEISSLMKKDISTIQQYYLQSLQYLKDWFGIQLDHYYVYIVQKDNKKDSMDS